MLDPVLAAFSLSFYKRSEEVGSTCFDEVFQGEILQLD